jgi:hypothetical protein
VCNDTDAESRHALTGARGTPTSAAFVDGIDFLAQITARTAASNSESNLEHAAAAAWLHWPMRLCCKSAAQKSR